MSTATNNPNPLNSGSPGTQQAHSSADPETAMNQLLMKQHDAPKSPFGTLASGASGYVQFKGRPGALELIIDTEAPLLSILEDLQQTLLANRAMLQHVTSLKLNFGMREVDKLQYGEIQRVVMAHHLKITGLILQPEALSSFLEGEFGIPVQIQLPVATSAPRVEKMAQASAQTDTHPTPVDVLRQNVAQVAPGASSVSEGSTSPQRRTVAGGIGPSPAPMIYTPDAMPSLDPLPALPPLDETPQPGYPARTPAQATRPATSASRLSQPSQPSQPMPHSAVAATHPPAPLASSAPSGGGSVQRAVHKVMRTCRAGTSLQFDGDVVIFGDLNAGAEVKASGDIIVLGALLGVAHAGCQGDTSARIYASDLSPTQLRVAHQIAIAPPSEASRQRSRLFFDMAFLNDEQQIEVKSVEAGRVPG